MLILGQNQKHMHVAAFHALDTCPAPVNPIPQHAKKIEVGPEPANTHTKYNKPVPPKRMELGLHTLLPSGDGEDDKENAVLTVSGKTLKHLLALMQRNALDFAALERYDAKLDSMPAGKKDTLTRHKQKVSTHWDNSGQTFRGGKTPFPKGRSAGKLADVALLQTDIAEYLRTAHKPGSDAESTVTEADEACLVNLRFLPDGSFDFAPEIDQESLAAITWGDNSVSSCRSYRPAKGPSTSAGAFPIAFPVSLVGGPKAILKSRAYDLAYLFLDPKCAQKTRGGLIFAKKRLLVAANRRFCRPFLSAIV
jgi:hypothetical protein